MPEDQKRLFEQLVRRSSELVRAFLLSSVRDVATAEELLQETFVRAWANFERFDRERSFTRWANGIAANLVADHRRKHGSGKLYFCDDESLAVLEESFRPIAELGGDTLDDQLEALRDCIAELSEKQRSAIALYYERGLSCEAIADRLGIGREAVKKHLQRGRSALLACIGRRLSA